MLAVLVPGGVDHRGGAVCERDSRVRARAREAVGVEEGAKRDLEVGAGDGAADLGGIAEDPAQVRGPRRFRVARDQGGEGGGASEAVDLRLGDRGLELLASEDAGEVEQRARRCGDRDSAVDGRLVRRERDEPRLDPGAIDAPWSDDLGPRAARLAYPPERSSGVVAQHAAWSGREDGGHPDARATHDRVADGEHTAMERLEAPHGEAMIDRVIAQTHGTELAATTPCWRAASRATAASVADSPPMSR